MSVDCTAETRPYPRIQLHAAQLHAAQPAASTERQVRHRVLVVAGAAWQRLALVKELQRDCEVLAVASYADALRALRDPALVCAIVAHLELNGPRDALQMFDAARVLCPDTAHVLIAEAPQTQRAAERFIRSRRAQQTVIAPWHEGQLVAAVGAACLTC